MASDPWDDITEKDAEAWAALEEKPAPQKQPPRVGGAEAFISSTVRAIPGANLLTNALAAAAQPYLYKRLSGDKGVRATLTPQAQAELEAMGEQPVEGPGYIDRFRDIRDERKSRLRAGGEQNPWESLGGTVFGTGLTMAAPAPKFGKTSPQAPAPTRAGRLWNTTKTGMGYGAVDQLLEGDADLTRGQFGQAAKETAMGSLSGGILGLAGGALVEAATPLFEKALRRYAIRQGTQHIQGGSDVMAANRNPLRPESVEEVLARRGIKPFETVEGTYQNIEKLAEEQGRIYAAIVDDLEKKGVRGPDVKNLADDFMARYNELYRETSANKGPADVFAEAASNTHAVSFPGPREAPRMPAGVEPPPLVEGPQSPTLGLMQSERIKQRLQDDARFDKRNPTGKEASLREAASMQRQAGEDVIMSKAMTPGVDPKIQALNAKFGPQKEIVGRLLDAEEAASRGTAKYLQRSTESLKDATTGGAIATAAQAPWLAIPITKALAASRNRALSTKAVGAYNLAEGLRTGDLGGTFASAAGSGADAANEFIRDYAEKHGDDPNMDPAIAALLRALRRPKPKENE